MNTTKPLSECPEIERQDIAFKFIPPDCELLLAADALNKTCSYLEEEDRNRDKWEPKENTTTSEALERVRQWLISLALKTKSPCEQTN